MEGASAGDRADAGVEFLEALRERFGLAAGKAGVVERRLEIGGLSLRLRFAGPALVELLLSPFEHLAAEGSGEPDIGIDVFDAGSTGVEPPPLPWDAPEPVAGTNPAMRYSSEHACVLATASNGALTAVAPIVGEAFFCLPSAAVVPPGERAAPLREALQLLASPRGRWMTHAGAVGRGGRGVLLVGRSGSGKSTLALACALAGMEFVADDYLLLEIGPPPVAHAMQSTAKLTADSAARLGLERKDIDRTGFEPTLGGPDKALIDVEALVPGLVRRRLRIDALIAPSVAEVTHPDLRQVGAASGLRALAPSTIMQMRSRTASLLGALGGLVRAVPSYELRLSPDSAANAAAVAGVVDGIG
jgi:hypothetical protein